MIKMAFVLTLAGFSSLGVPATLVQNEVASPMKDQQVIEESLGKEKTVEEVVTEYFSDAPILVEVARCESTLRHTDSSGAVVRGKANSRDVGVMQINEQYHLEDSLKMGIDIQTLEGNLAYARYLYEKKGLDPWKSSKKCWNRS